MPAPLHPVAAGVAACRRAGIPVITPDGWGARARYGTFARKPVKPGGQGFGHYVGGAVNDATFRGVLSAEAATIRGAEAYHMDGRGYRGLGYDTVVGQSAALYLARADARSAATSGDVDMDGIPNNDEADGMLHLIGGDQVPSPGSLRTARIFWAGWRQAVGPTATFHPHTDGRGTATACCGPHLIPWYRQLATTLEGRTMDADLVILYHPSLGPSDALSALAAPVLRPDLTIAPVCNAAGAASALAAGIRVVAVGKAHDLLDGDTDLRGVDRVDTADQLIDLVRAA